VFWFSFDEIRSAEYVINQLVDSIFGTEALAAPLEQKLAGLIKTLRAHPFLLVWDNFESASGIEGTEIRSMLSEDDRGLLKELLAGLRNGKTKVLITSRSAEKWLSTGECFRLPLSGLHGEELWQYCNQVLRDLGLTVKRDDEDFLELINELDGHPLALRAVLLRLKDKGAKELLADLRKEFALFEGDASSNRIFAALAVLDQGLPEEYSPVLQLIGLHRWFVDQDYLEQMLQNAEEATSTIQPCFALLETTGLLHDFGSNIFQMHPALQTHLKQRHPAARSLQRAFIDFMGSFADQLAPKELHEQSGSFSLHLANCWHALNIAQQLGIEQNVAALRQGIATYALNIRDYTGACQLFESLASQQKKYKNYKEEAAAYHQLGIVALEQRNFTTAEKWYEKSLSIEKKLGGELGGEFTYHQLGIIALEKNNFPAAKKLCEESLKIKKKLGHENEMATTYYQLGRIAQAQSDLVTAKKWYKKALALFEKLKQSQNVADTYNELGIIALDQNDFAEAEKWCSNSLMIKRKNGNEYRLGPVYHMLGSISIEKNDFIEAEKWSKAALTIFEKQGDEYGTANCYHQIGVLSHLQKAYWDAGRWYLKAILSFMHLENPHNAADGIKNFIMVLHAADPETEITLRKNWQQSGIDQTITLDQLEQQLTEQN
jgi:tetratricopeptide (TPR) repeat protein